MGKFMRKTNAPTPGVRTRAKALALAAATLEDSKPEYCYLQLRSRRLEKPLKLAETKKQSSTVKETRLVSSSSGTIRSAHVDWFVQVEDRGVAAAVNGFHEPFGENNSGFQPIQSAVRESTHSNLISDVGNISTPGSSTRYPSLTAENQRPWSSILTYIPSTREVDDLFAHLEQQVQQQQKLSTDKYNFDFINEIPLPGPYEWEKVNP